MSEYHEQREEVNKEKPTNQRMPSFIADVRKKLIQFTSVGSMALLGACASPHRERTEVTDQEAPEISRRTLEVELIELNPSPENEPRNVEEYLRNQIRGIRIRRDNETIFYRIPHLGRYNWDLMILFYLCETLKEDPQKILVINKNLMVITCANGKSYIKVKDMLATTALEIDEWLEKRDDRTKYHQEKENCREELREEETGYGETYYKLLRDGKNPEEMDDFRGEQQNEHQKNIVKTAEKLIELDRKIEVLKQETILKKLDEEIYIHEVDDIRPEISIFQFYYTPNDLSPMTTHEFDIPQDTSASVEWGDWIDPAKQNGPKFRRE